MSSVGSGGLSMPAFRHLLTRAQQVEYDRSNAMRSVRVPVSPRLERAVDLLQWALAQQDRERTQKVSQVICDELCSALRVPALRVTVNGVRPSNQKGELHGLYTPAAGTRRDHVEVWMATAKRAQVVAFKTFLRTLLHEICHHLDYHHFGLQESFHTDGFFKRESSLFHQIARLAPAADASATTSRKTD